MAVEGLLSAYHGSFGMRAISLRFSNVYGPNSGRKGSVVSAFCKQIARSNTLKVNGDGQQTQSRRAAGVSAVRVPQRRHGLDAIDRGYIVWGVRSGV